MKQSTLPWPIKAIIKFDILMFFLLFGFLLLSYFKTQTQHADQDGLNLEIFPPFPSTAGIADMQHHTS